MGWSRRCSRADPAARHYEDANRLIDDLARAAGRALLPESTDHRDSYLKAAPLIGRHAELEQLTTALESAVDGTERQRVARGWRERRGQVAAAR